MSLLRKTIRNTMNPGAELSMLKILQYVLQVSTVPPLLLTTTGTWYLMNVQQHAYYITQCLSILRHRGEREGGRDTPSLFQKAKHTRSDRTTVSFEHRFLPRRQRVLTLQGCYSSARHSVLACTYGAVEGADSGFAIAAALL